jgi:predicted ABC-type ATPase
VAILTLIAGPNGSGKSTLTEWVDLEDRGLLLDADAIARILDPVNPQTAAIAAGKEILRRIRECLARSESFAVETTLSSRTSLALMDRASARGYEIHLTFVALDSPERCIARIRTRVLRGGHSIPDADVSTPLQAEHRQPARSASRRRHRQGLRQFRGRTSARADREERRRHQPLEGIASLGRALEHRRKSGICYFGCFGALETI